MSSFFNSSLKAFIICELPKAIIDIFFLIVLVHLLILTVEKKV